ncbi:MAG: hypothetical protein M9894_00900 [Planctomycetes bacterium]|nr:hypothetical protein [Planctomycetota bacterium]
MKDRVRVFAEGGLAGVLVKRQRWTVLARFRGPEAERMARDLAALIAAGRLITGRDLAAEESAS